MAFSEVYAFLILHLTFFWNECHAQSNTITISTQLGKIRGRVNNEWSPTTIYSFEGIKYGVPPIGDLRFRQTQLSSDVWNGVYDATKYGSVCIQAHAPVGQTMSEDCLHLNIWTSNVNSSSSSSSSSSMPALLPVMFFIHGGAFVSGEGSASGFAGLNILGENQGDFVYVSINYRLGPLGFLNNADLFNEDPQFASYGGMNGVYDQITAIQWVSDNIKDYGGDKEQITIYGESAGALSVCYLLISPLVPTEVMFNRAILESGSCIGPWGPLSIADGLQFGNDRLTQAGYPINNVTYLRSLPAKEFSEKVTEDPWSVAVDGLILTELPSITFAKTNHVFNAKEAVVLGFNSMDGIIAFPFYGGPAPTNAQQYQTFVEYYVPNNKTLQDLLQNVYYNPSNFPFYPPNHNSFQLAWYSMNGDVCVSCPTKHLADNMFDTRMTEHVYVYEFRGVGENGSYYAPHASELPFVFDNKNGVGFFQIPWSQPLSDAMVSSWTNFAISGVPNVTNRAGPHIQWTPYSSQMQNVIVFDDNIRVTSGFFENYRQNVCDFWYNEVGFDIMRNICLDQGKPV